ncbi:MAG TPA: hypothetical protein VF502_02065 [Stellaceae bacterium]
MMAGLRGQWRLESPAIALVLLAGMPAPTTVVIDDADLTSAVSTTL